MKKSIGLVGLFIVELFCIIGVYLIGGKVGPWIWSACIFIGAPIYISDNRVAWMQTLKKYISEY